MRKGGRRLGLDHRTKDCSSHVYYTSVREVGESHGAANVRLFAFFSAPLKSVVL